MKIVFQPKDELLSRGGGCDECCVLLRNLCLQSCSPTGGAGSVRSAPVLTRARYYRKDRNEIDTSIQLPVDATHRAASPLSAVGLVQSPSESRSQRPGIRPHSPGGPKRF